MTTAVVSSIYHPSRGNSFKTIAWQPPKKRKKPPMNCISENVCVSSLAAFTSPGLIAADLRGRDLPSVIYELSGALQSEARIPELLPFYHAALSREYLCSTALSHEIAFPHAQISGLPRLTFAFGKSPEPLPWGSRTSSSVRFVFLIAAPSGNSVNYLSLIGGLAQFAKRSDLLQRLSKTSTPAGIYEFFAEIEISFRGGKDYP